MRASMLCGQLSHRCLSLQAEKKDQEKQVCLSFPPFSPAFPSLRLPQSSEFSDLVPLSLAV